MLSPLVVGPMMARTWLSSTSCFAKDTAFSAFPWESLMMSSIFLPRIPPDAFASSTSICRVRASGSPRVAAGPVTAKIAPILIGSAANAGTARNDSECEGEREDGSPAHGRLLLRWDGWIIMQVMQTIIGIVKENAAPVRSPITGPSVASALTVAIPFFSSTCSARSRSSMRQMTMALSRDFSTYAYMYSTFTLSWSSTSRMWESPPGRSSTSTAITSVTWATKPCAFRTVRDRSGLSTMMRRTPKSAVSARDRARMLIFSCERVLVTSASRPFLFSRKTDICFTLIGNLLVHVAERGGCGATHSSCR